MVSISATRKRNNT